MRERVISWIRKYDMLRAGDRVVVGVSGGADSVCLLHLLVSLQEEMGLEICAVHVHHGLRGEEADRDAAFAEKLAGRLKVPCRVVRVRVSEFARQQGFSDEEAGRILRYRILAEEARRLGGAKIAVGHQREDQAETILHNLFRGSALRGLAGMAPVSRMPELPVKAASTEGAEPELPVKAASTEGAEPELPVKAASTEGVEPELPVKAGAETAEPETGNGGRQQASMAGLLLIRPLLCVSREEIRQYLAREGLDCCEDSTNASGDYTRNRIRQMLPRICSEVNAGAVEHILAAGEKIARADAYFEREAERIWAESGVERNGCCGIQADVLARQPEILAGYLVMRMIRLCCGSVKDVASVHVEAVCDLARKGTGRRVCLPCALTAEREYGMIWLRGPVAEPAAGGNPPPALSYTRFSYEKKQKIPENQYTKWFDYDRIKGALSLRVRQAGDYITIKGGGHKSVKSYLIDEKVPRQDRDRIMVLAEGNHVLWIVGYRISEYYKVTEDTKEILQVQAYGGEEHGGEDSGTDPGREGK